MSTHTQLTPLGRLRSTPHGRRSVGRRLGGPTLGHLFGAVVREACGVRRGGPKISGRRQAWVWDGARGQGVTRVSREQGGTRVQAPRAPLGARGEEKSGHVLALGGWMGGGWVVDGWCWVVDGWCWVVDGWYWVVDGCRKGCRKGAGRVGAGGAHQSSAAAPLAWARRPSMLPCTRRRLGI